MVDSVSWISFALSALLVLEKFLSKNKLKKCKCCGACIEFESQPQERRKSNDKTKNNELDEVHPDKDVV